MRRSDRKAAHRPDGPGGRDERMKIETTGQVRQASKTRRTDRREEIGARFTDALSRMLGAGDGPAAVDGPGSATGVEALLAVQAAEGGDGSPQGRASQARQRANRQLEALEGLRRGLLAGRLTERDLLELARGAAERRSQVDDPKLAEVLDEVDLRVQVELAKLGISIEI